MAVATSGGAAGPMLRLLLSSIWLGVPTAKDAVFLRLRFGGLTSTFPRFSHHPTFPSTFTLVTLFSSAPSLKTVRIGIMAFSPAPSQQGTSVTVPLWIDGQEEVSSSTFDVFSPVLDDVCWNAVAASSQDAIRAVESSNEAFKSWSKTKPAVRSEVLLKTATILEANAAEYAGYMSTEMGAEVAVAQFFVLPLAIQMLKDLAGRCLSITGFVPTVQQEGQSSIVYKEPYGVTLGICPW